MLVAAWQWVCVWVVEKALVSFSPGETLVADAEVVVWLELCARVSVLLLVLQVSVQHAQTDGREGDQEAKTLPYFVAP